MICQGGAKTHFSMVVTNFINNGDVIQLDTMLGSVSYVWNGLIPFSDNIVALGNTIKSFFETTSGLPGSVTFYYYLTATDGFLGFNFMGTAADYTGLGGGSFVVTLNGGGGGRALLLFSRPQVLDCPSVDCRGENFAYVDVYLDDVTRLAQMYLKHSSTPCDDTDTDDVVYGLPNIVNTYYYALFLGGNIVTGTTTTPRYTLITDSADAGLSPFDHVGPTRIRIFINLDETPFDCDFWEEVEFCSSTTATPPGPHADSRVEGGGCCGSDPLPSLCPPPCGCEKSCPQPICFTGVSVLLKTPAPANFLSGKTYYLVIKSPYAVRVYPAVPISFGTYYIMTLPVKYDSFFNLYDTYTAWVSDGAGQYWGGCTTFTLTKIEFQNNLWIQL